MFSDLEFKFGFTRFRVHLSFKFDQFDFVVSYILLKMLRTPEATASKLYGSDEHATEEDRLHEAVLSAKKKPKMDRVQVKR